MNIKHIGLFILFLFVIASDAYSQPDCDIVHYGTEDGLPQHTIMDIIQDKKGFLWFSTWDGMSKFDGYNFYTYRIQGEDTQTKSNRIDGMYEDKYGFMWILPYDKMIYRFNPKTEEFIGLRSIPEFKDINFRTSKVMVNPSGKVWLLSDENGCICIPDSTFNPELFNVANNKIAGNRIYKIYEDAFLQTWILTDNGLFLLSTDNKTTGRFFTENGTNRKNKSKQAFYSITEFKDEIWFGSNNGRIWIYNKKVKNFSLFETPIRSNISIIKDLNEDLILITTNKEGFFLYSRSANSFEAYNTGNLKNMPDNHISSYYADRYGNIWMSSESQGVMKFNIKKRSLKYFLPEVENQGTGFLMPKFFVLEDNNGRVWVHPKGGGFSLYDSEREELLPFYNEPGSSEWRFSNMLHLAFCDKQGNLWLSTRSHGVEKVIFNDGVFQLTVVDSNIHSTINNDVRSIFEDDKLNLWVSTRGERIYLYDASRKKTGYLCSDGSVGYGTPIKGIAYSLFQDRDRNIWVGTRSEGLYKLTPVADGKRYIIKNYKNDPNNLYSLSHNAIYSIFQDKNGRIWVGTYGGGLNLVDDRNEGRFFNYKNTLKQYPIDIASQVRAIADDKYGNICVGTTFGLIMFSPDFDSESNIDYHHYNKKYNDPHSLNGYDVYDVYTTKKGETFFAVFGGGVNKVNSVNDKGFPVSFTSYTTKNGLPSNIVLLITEDKNGKLWITSESSISKFNPDKETFETYNEISRIIHGQYFSEGAKCQSSNGTISFGFTKGFISVNPDKIKENRFSPYVALTNLKISNRNILVGVPDSPLKKNIDNMEVIKLSNKQNFISLEFAALDYITPQNITYAYKLEGFDEDWIISKKQRSANYTNLHPGRYVFRVKATNSDGIWTDNEHTLTIDITPSFWQTGWALLIYMIVFILLLFVIIRIVLIFYQLKNKVVLEQEQTEMKTRFFTDISHEIRTPLTMIVSPIENIIEEDKTPEKIKDQLKVVLKNTNRMLRMVNQILDFRKIQKRDIDLQEIDLGKYVPEICNNFIKIAEVNHIDIVVNNYTENGKIWADRDSIEKLVYNLLSNALKYTPEGKKIFVNINQKDNSIALQIKDEGKGMPKDIQNKLFTRFGSYSTDKSKPSTGIGLSIVKEVADKHHAKIQVESEPNKGSSFTVYFQTGTEHFKNDSNITLSNAMPDIKGIATKNEIVYDINNPDAEDNKKLSILVVEDDEDLRQFIVSTLQPYYHTLEAVNGKIAYEITLSSFPDFILSDIMMPETDGMEFLKKVRSNPDLSHIPFILLTAKTDMDSRIEGIEYGADDYVPKPFNVRFLRKRINNIIEQRQRLYRSFLTGKKNDQKNIGDDSDKPKISPQDEQFLKKAQGIIENNIDNSDFLIDNLVSEMAMSRKVFFNKLKSLTGLAPVEFIREIKIKHAAELLATTNYTVKEISFMVGFSDTKYFTQCFKKIFETTPSLYRNRFK
ncbi:MAG: two-component regulator propeller domain-containing protein [Dysgonomonas sp.]